MAGWFPNADVAVAAMGVGFNTTALTYTISQGVGGERPSHMCMCCDFHCFRSISVRKRAY